MTKLTDYGTLVLAYLAATGPARSSAAEVADKAGLPPATVAKLLKALTRAGLVTSFRGAQGGYALARPAAEITAAEVIDALEGPVAITECAVQPGQCDLEAHCLVGGAWQRINVAIRRALEHISLAEMTEDRSVPMMDLRTAVNGSSARTSGH